MKVLFFHSALFALLLLSCADQNQKKSTTAADGRALPDTNKTQSYFIDVHNLEPGKVAFEDVAKAHQKDLATEGKYGVNFVKFWVDEKQGKVYCLSQAKNAASVEQTHKEAHGLMPSVVYEGYGWTGSSSNQ